jgi:hypothetical protein
MLAMPGLMSLSRHFFGDCKNSSRIAPSPAIDYFDTAEIVDISMNGRLLQ